MHSACDCSTKRRRTNSTSSDYSACGFQQRTDGCYTRDSQYDAHTVDLIPGYKVCTLRAGPSFLQQEHGIAQMNGVSCSSTGTATQLCGSLCWPSATPCPLQYIEFAGSGWQRNTTAYNEVRSFPGAPMMRFFLRRMITSTPVGGENRSYRTSDSLLSGDTADANLGFVRRRTRDAVDTSHPIVNPNSTARNV